MVCTFVACVKSRYFNVSSAHASLAAYKQNSVTVVKATFRFMMLSFWKTTRAKSACAEQTSD
jgi:hypothetical protein